ncbi:MAG: PPOX class F420-dependent oxidoreductase [Nakamurella sp.]
MSDAPDHSRRASGESPLDVLGGARTVLLITFRKDGTPVPTPVWVVRTGDELQVWTSPDSGKYKRIRRTPAVTVAPCSTRGTPRGEPVTATARLLDAVELQAVQSGIRRKYGLIGRLAVLTSDVGARFRGAQQGGLGIVLD